MTLQLRTADACTTISPRDRQSPSSILLLGYLRTISRDLTYAAIDIGSNAVRLLIGDVVERDDHPVIKKTSLIRVPIRLGADVFDSGTISAAKRDQLIKSLKAFRLLTEVYGAHYLRCCATSGSYTAPPVWQHPQPLQAL